MADISVGSILHSAVAYLCPSCKCLCAAEGLKFHMIPVISAAQGLQLAACRSGRSLTIVTQYDVELFQKIEALTGHKMEEYPSEQEAVLLLLERVGEAQRISTMQV